MLMLIQSLAILYEVIKESDVSLLGFHLKKGDNKQPGLFLFHMKYNHLVVLIC